MTKSTSAEFNRAQKLYGIQLVNKDSKVVSISNRFNFRENPNSLIADIVGFRSLIDFKTYKAYLIYSIFIDRDTDTTERHDIRIAEIKEKHTRTGDKITLVYSN